MAQGTASVSSETDLPCLEGSPQIGAKGTNSGSSIFQERRNNQKHQNEVLLQLPGESNHHLPPLCDSHVALSYGSKAQVRSENHSG